MSDVQYTPAQWDFITTAFEQALELPEHERPGYLDHACEGQPAVIRTEIEAMLRAEAESAGFLEFDAVPPPPEQLPGGWKVLEKIGEGGMGGVFRVQRRTSDGFEQIAAAKLLSVFRGPMPELSRRLRAERRILAGLDHPNITRILDGGEVHGAPYFVMELVEGEPLLTYVQRLDLSLPARLDLFRKICMAVQYAHQRLVVHRDIKPSNIMITTAGGEPKLLDFGIAKVLEPEQGTSGELTAPLYQAASVTYASPEQLRGQTVSTAADIYSLGVLLFEMLTGSRRRVGSHSTPESMAREIEETPLPKASAVHPGISRDLDAIIHKATRAEPAARYASVEQLQMDLERFRKGLPVEARQGAWRYVAGKFIARNRWAVAGAAVLLVAAGAFVLEARRAENQLRETRAMAGLLATQMPARVAGPGDFESLRFRRKVADYGLTFLDERLAAKDWSPQQLALGYFNLANTFGAPEQISLGDFPRAAECYSRVVALLWPLQPGQPELRNALYLSMLRLPRVHLRMRQATQARQTAAECESRGESLSSDSPGVRRLVANCRFSLAMANADLGVPQNEKAVAAALEIVETLRLPSEQDIAAEPMSAAANRVSAVSLRVRDLQQSLRFAEMSMQSAASEPPGPESTLMRGVALRNAATALSSLDQHDKAKASIDASITLLRELSAQQPDDVQSRAFLAQALIEKSTLRGVETRTRDLAHAREVLLDLIGDSRYPMARSLLAQAYAEEAKTTDSATACELRRKAVEQLDRMSAERLILPAETALASQLRSRHCRY